MDAQRIAQWGLVALIAFNVLSASHDHGKPKEGTYNFWAISATWVFFVLVLILAGAFSKLGLQ